MRMRVSDCVLAGIGGSVVSVSFPLFNFFSYATTPMVRQATFSLVLLILLLPTCRLLELLLVTIPTRRLG